MNPWTALIGPVVGAFNRWRDRVQEIKLKKHELRVKKLETSAQIAITKAEAEVTLLQRRAEADIDWEMASIANSSWKDDGLTVYTLVLLTCLFVPPLQPYIEEGFRILGQLPMWFQVMVAVVFGSAFGVRVFTNFKSLVKSK